MVRMEQMVVASKRKVRRMQRVVPKAQGYEPMMRA